MEWPAMSKSRRSRAVTSLSRSAATATSLTCSLTRSPDLASAQFVFGAGVRPAEGVGAGRAGAREFVFGAGVRPAEGVGAGRAGPGQFVFGTGVRPAEGVSSGFRVLRTCHGGAPQAGGRSGSHAAT